MAETLGVILAATGVGLVYAALTNQNPVAELRAALSTGDVSGSTPITSGNSTTTAAPAGLTSAAAGSTTPQLVAIGQGSHKLTAPAAAAFQRWQQMFGSTIKVTDSYRSYASQAAAYASDPNRFGPAATSKHVQGIAVDVDLTAVGANPAGQPNQWTRDAVYARLVQTAAAAGWCNYQVRNGSTGSRTAEPWHFSYGVCG